MAVEPVTAASALAVEPVVGEGEAVAAVAVAFSKGEAVAVDDEAGRDGDGTRGVRGEVDGGGRRRRGQLDGLAGPFGDRMGELIELDGAGRVRVLIELLGGRIPAILSRGEVMAAR